MESEKPKREWASYNRRNIEGGLYQVEDHARVLAGKGRKEDSSCIKKHLSFISSELGELTSHTNSPEKAEEYAEIRLEVDRLYDQLDDLSPQEIIEREREIRGKFEDTAGISVKECGACSPEVVKGIREVKKHLNKEKNLIRNGGEIMRTRKLMGYAGGSFLGKGIEEIADTFLKGTTFGFRNSDLLELGLGVGLPIASLYNIIPRKYQEITTIAGLFMLADKSIDLMRKVTGAGAARAPVRVKKVGKGAKKAKKPAKIAGLEGKKERIAGI